MRCALVCHTLIRCKVTLTAWEIRCARDKSLGCSGRVCSRERDCCLSSWTLNDITKGNGCGIGGVEAKGNGWGG